jgi:DNA-binding CsgD family transcriptional regulator
MTSVPAEKFQERRSFDCHSDEVAGGNVLDLIDVFSGALCVVDKNLQVIRANLAANVFLAGPGRDGFLRLLNQSSTTKPAAMRKQFVDSLVSGKPTCAILTSFRFEPLFCTLRPTQAGPSSHGIIALTPSVGGSRKVMPYLRQIYKLSHAEAEIAADSAAGIDVVQMAQSRGVSVHTLRSQIASIKSKMELSRMTEIAVTVCRIEAAMTWL